MCTSRPGARQRGVTLVELILSIVIISVGLVGILSAMSLTTRHSADPLPRKQALAIAEALLEEVQLMPFTLCDPDGFTTAGCAVNEGMGPEAVPAPERRGHLSAPFDNVNDYHGLELVGGASDIGGSGNVTIPAGYTARIAVTADAGLGPAAQRPPQNSVLRISVTVTHGGDSIVLEGYRSRYAADAAVLQ